MRVDDLPLDKRTKAFGEALGNWLGKVVKVDVGEDGLARGTQLRVRTKIALHEPLVRGFSLRRSQKMRRKHGLILLMRGFPTFVLTVEGSCMWMAGVTPQLTRWPNGGNGYVLLRGDPHRDNTEKNSVRGARARVSAERAQCRVEEKMARPPNSPIPLQGIHTLG